VEEGNNLPLFLDINEKYSKFPLNLIPDLDVYINGARGLGIEHFCFDYKR